MEIEKRVQVIERELAMLRSRARRLRVLATGACAACAVLLLGAATPDPVPDLLRAHRLEIVSNDNRAVVILAVDSDGTGILSTHDREGHPLVAARTSEKGDGALMTFNRAGYELVEVGQTNAGAGDVSVFDGRGIRLAAVTANREGDGEVRAFNRRGHMLAGLHGTETAGGALYLRDAVGRDLVSLGLDGVTTARVYDGAGKAAVWIGGAPDDGGYVSAFAPDGTTVRAAWPAAPGAAPARAPRG